MLQLTVAWLYRTEQRLLSREWLRFVGLNLREVQRLHFRRRYYGKFYSLQPNEKAEEN